MLAIAMPSLTLALVNSLPPERNREATTMS
jgi:hypothetical protein